MNRQRLVRLWAEGALLISDGPCDRRSLGVRTMERAPLAFVDRNLDALLWPWSEVPIALRLHEVIEVIDGLACDICHGVSEGNTCCD